ncbi:MAG: hypothetical protein WC959_05590 [Kiritimatiellales bacterium]
MNLQKKQLSPGEKVQEIFEEFQPYFKQGLHNLLWQILVNKRLEGRGRCTLYPLIDAGCWAVVIVEENVAKYLPTTCVIDQVSAFPFEICERLSVAVFGISAEESRKIAHSSVVAAVSQHKKPIIKKRS